jgi:hypothetical protein
MPQDRSAYKITGLINGVSHNGPHTNDLDRGASEPHGV